MQDGDPVGGQWNFDPENRKALPRRLAPPPRNRFAPDAVTRTVLDLVGARFGNLEPFGWAVTRAGALHALEHFVTECLPGFGKSIRTMANWPVGCYSIGRVGHRLI